IEVHGASGGVKVHSDYGKLTLQDVGGDIDATTSSGEIEVLHADSAHTLHAQSQYGSVTLQDVSGAVDAASASGSIELKEAQAVDTVKLHTDYGSITCQGLHAAGSHLNVDLTTESGQI